MMDSKTEYVVRSMANLTEFIQIPVVAVKQQRYVTVMDGIYE